MNLDRDGEWESQVPITGGRFLLTGEGCPDQTGHNDFPTDSRTNPGYFAITMSQEKTSLLIFPGSHQYVWYDTQDKKSLAETLKMTEITIPMNSVFIGHGHVQHAGCGWRGFHALRYHMYVIPSSMTMADSVFFAYGYSFNKSNNRRLHNTESCASDCLTSSFKSHSISARNAPRNEPKTKAQEDGNERDDASSSDEEMVEDSDTEIQPVTEV